MSDIEKAVERTMQVGERIITKLEAEIASLKSQLAEAQVKLEGSEERVKMLLEAKNHWQDRAVSAEDALFRLECYDDAAAYTDRLLSEDIRAVCRELRAAREAVKDTIPEEMPNQQWNDALRMVDDKMKAARNDG